MTDSPKVKKARKMNLELIFAEHIEKCPTCVLKSTCELLKYAKRYKLKITRFKDRKSKRRIYKFGPSVELDGSQCIDCRACVDICHQQGVDFLKIKDYGYKIEVVPNNDGKHDCVYCGQCAVHCPVTAAQEQLDFPEVENLFKKKNKKILVAQIAPSIRSSIGEMFGLPYGKIMTGQLVASLRKLGFDYVFDVNFGADITTMVEAEELIERLKKMENQTLSREKVGGVSEFSNPPLTPPKRGIIPMFTSCCPAWVRFVEFYHPELIPNITTARSPQVYNGEIIKTYWAEKMKIKPSDIIVVSIMPCTAKKFEAARKELKIKNLNPVDYVLTTRELGYLLEKYNINLGKIKPAPADHPLGKYSGAAAIYGATGGVMESALRTVGAYCNTPLSQKIDFKEVRGMSGIKKAAVMVSGKKLKVAVANGLGNAGKIIAELEKNPNAYHYVEVMACPGGCIGGGGQPIPTTPEIREKRAKALYAIDKKLKTRTAHENLEAIKALEHLKKNNCPLHTHYHHVKKPEAV